MHQRIRIPRDEQLALVADQQHSGLSAVDFCRERGIHYQNFLRWRRAISPRHDESLPAFVELAVESPPVPQPALLAELSLGGGLTLKVFMPQAAKP